MMETKKLEYGSDEHLTIIGAAQNLHALTGQDRADMLAFGRACIAAERERCAKLCDGLTHALDIGGNAYRREAFASQCAAAIRKG